MSAAPLPSGASPSSTARLLGNALAPDSIWRAPLVPAALALTAGILLDRRAGLPMPVSLLGAAGCLLAWFCSRGSPHRGLPLVYLALAGVAFGAAYHHYRRDVYRRDDVALLATVEPVPVQLQGVLDEEPVVRRVAAEDPLRSFARGSSTTTVLRAIQVRRSDSWMSVSGRVRVVGVENWPELHSGDTVEIVGQLALLAPPSNPGEFDFAGHLRDRGIRTTLAARKTPGAIVRLERGWTTSFEGWMAVMRGRGQQILRERLPARTEGLAVALLLGDGDRMTRADWDKYIRTGVIHVLAISGQHLVILAGFLWFVLPRLGVRQRRAAWLVALVLLGYALLTGGRPPALRSAITVCAVCGGIFLRQRVMPANLFALSWLGVALLNPTDLFSTGCLLSFLSVAVLYWCGRTLFRTEPDPLAQLVDSTRPRWQRGLRWLGSRVAESYGVTLVIWLAITPLAAARYQMISPSGIVLGPPLVLLTTVALFAGFLLLLTGVLCLPLSGILTPIVHGSLSISEALVELADRLPGSHLYVGVIPEWWLWAFYLGLLAVLTQAPLRQRWRWAGVAGLGWMCVGLVAGAARLPDDELRCTFLAVGHGGCTVLETSDGRTLLYDAGSLAGPDVTRRQIAPFLWHRGIRRIDEVLLSHADLDHFNGLLDLLDRFAVGQVTCNPTFADKAAPGVERTLRVLRERGIPVRTVAAGARLRAGDVTLDVLHPPATGPEGNENARSLVLQIRHAGRRILLTGDLEGEGLQRVLYELPARRVEVLMAPHHGSHRSNVAELANWARPRIVVASQARSAATKEVAKRYRIVGAHYFDTARHGAVTIRSHASGLVVETFLTQERLAVRGGDQQD